MELKVGVRVKDYILEEQLGKGASGEVWKASDDYKTVAIKFMNEQLITSANAQKHRKRLLREVEALQKLKHPNIPTLYDADIDYERPYLAMQYIGGESYEKLIPSGELMRIPLARRIQIIMELSRALWTAHQAEIIHRDIKPANITGTDTPYLLDFSVALEASDLGMTNQNIGTAPYMPPDGIPDKLGDIYSFALVSYEIIFGKHAVFTAEDHKKQMGLFATIIAGERIQKREWRVPSRIPLEELPTELIGVNLKRLDDIFQKGIGTREERYTDPREFARALRTAMTRQQVEGPETGKFAIPFESSTPLTPVSDIPAPTPVEVAPPAPEPPVPVVEEPPPAPPPPAPVENVAEAFQGTLLEDPQSNVGTQIEDEPAPPPVSFPKPTAPLPPPPVAPPPAPVEDVAEAFQGTLLEDPQSNVGTQIEDVPPPPPETSLPKPTRPMPPPESFQSDDDNLRTVIGFPAVSPDMMRPAEPPKEPPKTPPPAPKAPTPPPPEVDNQRTQLEIPAASPSMSAAPKPATPPPAPKPTPPAQQYDDVNAVTMLDAETSAAGGNRNLVIIGAVIAVVVIIALVVILGGGGGNPPTSTPTVEAAAPTADNQSIGGGVVENSPTPTETPTATLTEAATEIPSETPNETITADSMTANAVFTQVVIISTQTAETGLTRVAVIASQTADSSALATLSAVAPATATRQPSATPSPTNRPTETPIPASPTVTNTPRPPTATLTFTPQPPTATLTSTIRPTATLTFTPAPVIAATSTRKPTSTIAPSATVTAAQPVVTSTRRPTSTSAVALAPTTAPTGQTTLTDNLSENLRYLLTLIDADQYQCVEFNQVYQHIEDHLSDADSNYEEYGEDILDAMEPIYTGFCQSRNANDLQLSARYERDNDDLLDIVKEIIRLI